MRLGLRIGGGSSGLDLASELVKALAPDPLTVAKLTELVANVESSRVRDQYNRALEAQVRGKEARDAEDRRLQHRAVPGYTQLEMDAQGNVVAADTPPPST